ncbi:unnamed protein product [Rotaria sp. Silwood2]|nr:unnamed protein product [Rotaria sp. Silwood2]CAF4299321.1 unnamed protein product [Rotaria sp. Silwood2]
MSNKSTRIKTGFISNIAAKLAANLHIDEKAISGRDWADDEVKIEGDEDDLNRENLNNNQNEQGEAVGLKLEELVGRFQIAYHLITIEKLRSMLLSVPLFIVESCQFILESQP